MKYFKLSAVFLSLLSFSGLVLAQGPNVFWTPAAQNVPLSPWLSALLTVMLTFAFYAFIRRRAKQGYWILFAAILVGGMSLYTNNSGYAGGATYTISTPSGSDLISCMTVQNSANNVPVLLTVTSGGSFVGAACHTGTVLAPNGTCTMVCT
jgi:hypothetical protein